VVVVGGGGGGVLQTINLDAVVIDAQRFVSMSSLARRRLPEYLVTCRGAEAHDRQLWIIVNGTKLSRILSGDECVKLWRLVRDVQKLKLVYDEEQATVLFVGCAWPEDAYRTPLIVEGIVHCNSLDEVLERARALDNIKPLWYLEQGQVVGAGSEYTFSPLRVPTVEEAQIQEQSSQILISPN